MMGRKLDMIFPLYNSQSLHGFHLKEVDIIFISIFKYILSAIT